MRTISIGDLDVAEPELRPEELRVYLLDLQLLGERQDSLAAVLSFDEQQRSQRFIRRADRQRFIVVRGTLRRLLATLAGQAPQALQIAYGPQGKPCLAGQRNGDQPLAFNVSHSGGMSVIAVSRDTAVGVDVEHIRPIPDALAIAQRFFSPSEVYELENVPRHDLDLAFLRCWTRKEAHIKALGAGLYHPLDSFAVCFSPEDRATVIAGRGSTQPWTVVPLDVGTGYVSAISAPARTTLNGEKTALACTRVRLAG
jgi:4'-phosphopantetheinyl transferase